MNKANNLLEVKVNKALDPTTQEEVESFTYTLVYNGDVMEEETVNSMFECEQEACKLFGVNNYTVNIKE